MQGLILPCLAVSLGSAVGLDEADRAAGSPIRFGPDGSLGLVYGPYGALTLGSRLAGVVRLARGDPEGEDGAFVAVGSAHGAVVGFG